jgi:hypothetical protein
MTDVTRREFIQTLGALAGATIAAQFDRRLETVARALSGPQEWTLSFDESELLRLLGSAPTTFKPFVLQGTLHWGMPVETGGTRAVIGDVNDLWKLATLTSPDGDQWRTTDGENWTCGDRRMRL